MKRNILLYLLAACLCICGCEFGAEDEDSDYEDMTAAYGLFSVIELWDAMEGDEDYNGSYVLVQGVLFDVDADDYMVTLMDSGTSKTIECEFDSDIDLTTLVEVLDNNHDDSDQDVVTIAGICRFYTSSSSYPYFTGCDYYYVNSDE